MVILTLIFFHAFVTSRSKVNKIHKIQNDNAVVIEDPNQIKGVTNSYFENLFMQRDSVYAPVVNVLEPWVSSEDNVFLTRPFSHLGFSSAISQMHSDKSLGPYGFNSAFFKKSWEVCGDDIFDACCFWLDRVFFPATVNDTNIALIPKNNNPMSMKDWRPISLCNVVYKILSKVLANRLKMVLHKCVSNVQSV